MSRSRNFSRHEHLDDAWDDFYERNERKNKGRSRRHARRAKQYAVEEYYE